MRLAATLQAEVEIEELEVTAEHDATAVSEAALDALLGGAVGQELDLTFQSAARSLRDRLGDMGHRVAVLSKVPADAEDVRLLVNTTGEPIDG